MTPGDAMRLGWRPPIHIGALAELGEEYVALQGVWQDIDPSRFQRGSMNIFPLPFRRAGSSGRNHNNDEASGEHDQDLPDQHEQVPEEDEPLGEEPSPEQTLSQPGQERFDVFTQAGQSGDQEEAAHGPQRRLQQEASHGAMRPNDIPEPEPEGEDDELHPGHHGDEHLHGQVRRVQQHGHGEDGHQWMTSDGHGRSSHGEEDQESNETNEAEHLEISSDSSRIALDFETNSEGERQAEAQNRAQDVDNRYWMTLEETGRRIGEMIADNSNHYDKDELYDVIPDDQETFDWHRQQTLMRGQGVETDLVHAGHELASLINQILDTAMTQRVVLNGDMFGRLQILHKEILEAIDDCTTPEGCRRSQRMT